MKNRKTYASRLTKEMLIANGIELITEDGTVIKNGKQVIPTQDKRTGYLMLNLHELDEDGKKIKIPRTRIRKGYKKPSNTYDYKRMTVGLHRAIWAWICGVVEEGKVVDSGKVIFFELGCGNIVIGIEKRKHVLEHTACGTGSWNKLLNTAAAQ